MLSTTLLATPPSSLFSCRLKSPPLRSNSFQLQSSPNSCRNKIQVVTGAMLLPDHPVVSDVCATAVTGVIALSSLRVWQETAKLGIVDQDSLRIGENKRSRVLFGIMLMENPVVVDFIASVVSGSAIMLFLRFWEETAKRGLDQKLNRKLVHISIGMVFLLCWPLFSASSGRRGAILAAITPGLNIFRMLFLGLGILKDEATVKSISRYGDHRELLKGPMYYATAITMVCIIYWRTSPIAIAAICNLCAGDGFADIIGRRFGHQKLAYNRDKSVAGSIAMATAGFLTSVLFMYYFASFGYIQGSHEMVWGFLVTSLASAVVESLPISTKLDDNLTVSLTSILVGILVF